MRRIENLELHVAHACNLTCESCSHYSNHGHQGVVSLADADAWMQLWNQRLVPTTFSLLGGEPTIHPQLTEFVLLARARWPRARLCVVTNGFFLHRHPDLPKVLAATGTRLVLSIHHDGPAYQEKLRPILDVVEGWTREHAFAIEYRRSNDGWTRRYRGFGAAMEPYAAGRPGRSWQICPAKFCRQLFDGKIWKCSPLAYLKLQDAKYGLSAKWQPYLAYRPLEPDCSERELHAFFARRAEPVCGMCPAARERFDKPNPLGAATRADATSTDATCAGIEPGRPLI